MITTKVLSEQSLMEYFNDCYNERLFLMEVDKLPDSDVRQIVTNIIGEKR